MAIISIVLITVGINIGGLSSYYQRNRIRSMEAAYKVINDSVMQNEYGNLETVLGDYSRRENISIAVYDTNSDDTIVSSERDHEFLLSRLRDKLFGEGRNAKEIELKKTGNYTITRSGENIEFFGYCSDNRMMVLMSSPLVGMMQNATESNRFFIFAALIAVIISFAGLVVMTKKVSEVAELEAANEKLQIELEEKERQNRRQQDFISNVSHELKTPLALIQGYAEGLHDGLCNDDESRTYYSEIIMDEAGRMNQIVRQLLLLNSLESGLDKLEYSIFDLSEMVRGVVASTQLLADQKKAVIEKHLIMNAEVFADAFKIESAVTNYLSNAIHHVSEGGIIRVSLSDAGENVRLTVFNTGNRIPEEELEHIWDKFYKIDKARTRSYGGSGIGLSIVKAVMDAHGKGYGVRNLTDGVEFWFELGKANDRQKGINDSGH